MSTSFLNLAPKGIYTAKFLILKLQGNARGIRFIHKHGSRQLKPGEDQLRSKHVLTRNA